MPTIKRFHRCRIEMYFGDHNPPHFHVITNRDERVAMAIRTLTIMAGAADERDITEAIEWARANRDELRGWEKIVRLLRVPPDARVGGALRANPGHLVHQTPRICPQRTLPRTPGDALATVAEFFSASDCALGHVFGE